MRQRNLLFQHRVFSETLLPPSFSCFPPLLCVLPFPDLFHRSNKASSIHPAGLSFPLFLPSPPPPPGPEAADLSCLRDPEFGEVCWTPELRRRKSFSEAEEVGARYGIDGQFFVRERERKEKFPASHASKAWRGRRSGKRKGGGSHI